MGWHYGWGHPHSWVGVLFMVVAMVLFWGGLITLVLLVLKRFVPKQGERARTSSSAQEILAERFAKGEIDEEEYLHRRDILRES